MTFQLFMWSPPELVTTRSSDPHQVTALTVVLARPPAIERPAGRSEWVAPQKVLGGNVGFGVILPFGRKAIDVDIDALATLTLPLLNRTLEVDRRFHFDESTTNIGDPALDALIGWHQGNWHWNLQALLNVPIA